MNGRPGAVHLIGSVPLRDAEEVFLTAGRILGDRLRRMPDGETGERRNWIAWQHPVFCSRPQFEVVPPDPREYQPRPRVKLRRGADPAQITFERLGYAAAARQSYALFARLQHEGQLPSHWRFQVSLPTPVAPIGQFVVAEDQAAAEPAYERRLLEELDEITASIPHRELAIQWDTAIEFGLLEGVSPIWFEPLRAGIMERLLRIGRRVPADVEMGYHLCYGDANHKHFIEPEDTSKLVDVASELGRRLDRPLNWIHMPVPRTRVSDSYFEPLKRLKLRPETELYLGLVHYTDGIAGTRRRIAAARRAIADFGIATECGLGRRPSETISDLLRIHAQIADEQPFRWPAGFARIPKETWASDPVDSFGLMYDTVENHGWYVNLEPTVAQLHEHIRPGHVIVDYSGGTGILVDRLFSRIPEGQVGIVIVDASPKFLRVALEKFQDEERVAFRLIRYLKAEKRLQLIDEVIEPALLARGVDAVVSTNAIHLYYDLPETLRSWARILRPGGRALVQSGNIRNPSANPGEWIIDETVGAINEQAAVLVRADPHYTAYRAVLEDDARMAAYTALREKFFLPVRPLEHYLCALEGAGFKVQRVFNQTIEARVGEWFDFLAVYHEGVLGWVGGSERVDGAPPSETAVRDRLALIRSAMEKLFGGADSFPCCWTYITCEV